MSKKILEKYGAYCRPETARIMEAVRLDKAYFYGKGDYLYYLDDNENEVKVLDFLGGYGSTLFGHNNPELIEIAKSGYDKNIPFGSQASCRTNAAKLGEKINQMMFERTGKNYIVTLANSGAEGVEAAIKHSEHAHMARIKEIHNDMRKRETHLLKQYRDGELEIDPELTVMIRDKFGVPHGSDFNRYLWAVRNYNYQTFNQTPVFLSLTGSFHGKTTGAVQLTHYEGYREPYQRIGINVTFLEPGDTEALNAAVRDSVINYYWLDLNEKGQLHLVEKEHVNISAFFIEPIQGEGGIHPIPSEYLDYYRTVADECRFPLVFDEIQCGMGRTGTFLYSEQQSVYGDYYLLSKSFGGGLAKISALLIPTDQYEPEFGLIHTSTFAEDEQSSAIALGALNILDRDDTIMSLCREKGQYLKAGIQKIGEDWPGVIKEVRGVGLMLGIQFHSMLETNSMVMRMLSGQDIFGYIATGYMLNEHNIRIAPTISNMDTIRIEPSAYISIEDCDTLIKALRQLVEIVYKQNSGELLKYIINKKSVDPAGEIENFRTEFKPFERPKNARKVALLTHLIQSEHLAFLDSSMSLFDPDEAHRFVAKVYGLIKPQIYEQFIVKSASGEMVELCWIGLFIDSLTIADHMMNGSIEVVHNAIEEAVELAIDEGYHVIGFGGFTSIVTRNCTTIVSESAAMTSGNALTVGMGLDAMYKSCEDKNIALSDSCLASIGANGNICSIYSEIMAEQVPKIILIGRVGGEERLKCVASDIYANAYTDILAYELHLQGKDEDVVKKVSELQGVASKIYSTQTMKALLENKTDIDDIGMIILEKLADELGEDVPVKMTSDYSALKEANLIVGASNNPGAVIFPDMLADGPVIINDIAVPNDTDQSVFTERDDVHVIGGGLVKLPYNPDMRLKGSPVEEGLIFACQAEAILLGMIGSREHYSYGRIQKQQVKNIMEIARMNGFTLGKYKTEKSY